MPGLDVRRAEPELLGEVGALVDEVFAATRRSLSLAERFPHVLTAPNAANVFVGLARGRVIATVVTRHFTWRRGEESGRAAMAGLVATHPAHRGQGIATGVLEAAVAGLAADGASAVVLWATRPGLYERVGFRLDDPGVLGAVPGGAAGRGLPAPEGIDPGELETIRGESQPLRVDRTVASWTAVPPPAEEVVVYRTAAAYALAGRAGGATYLYELAGDERDFDSLLGAVRRDAEWVFANDTPGTSSHARLDAAGVEWESKTLGMWLGLAPGAATGLSIPYFDRI
jgi:predicted N-acetyltransferase YhbS